jgi:hypothetical protein
LVTSLIFLALPTVARAQASAPSPIGPAQRNNDPCTSISAIVTRPTVTNSVCTVRPNHVLIETGYQNTSALGAGNTITYPQSLIRVGTEIRGLELDITPPQFVQARSGGVLTQGVSDVSAGLKYVLGYTAKFNYGVQTIFSAPTGTRAFSANGAQSTYAVNAGYTLSPVFSLATTLSAQSLTNGVQHFSSFVPSLVLSAALPNSSSVFGEVASFSNAIGPGTPTRTQYILGAYHDFGQRLQVDASVATSPTTATGKYHYIGFGASYYF